MTFCGVENSIFNHLAHETVAVQPPVPSRRSLLTLEASTALVRLDERLSAAPAAVRAGWISRAFIYEAAASLRLDGLYVTTQDLLLILNDSLDRTPDQDLGRAVNIHTMLMTMNRRNPRNLLNPNRVAALARLRLRGGKGRAELPTWLASRLYSAEAMREALREALKPSFASRLKTVPSLEAAAHIIAHWRVSGAADCIGAAPGRALAMAWVRRAGLTAGYYLLPSIGFLGHASEFRPDLENIWTEQFLKACGRAVDWGFKLHRHLLGAHRRVHEAAPSRRTTSHMATLIDLVIAAPAVSALTAGRSLRITPHAARAMLGALEKRGLVYEITGRNSFRLYTAAPLAHLPPPTS